MNGLHLVGRHLAAGRYVTVGSFGRETPCCRQVCDSRLVTCSRLRHLAAAAGTAGNVTVGSLGRETPAAGRYMTVGSFGRETPCCRQVRDSRFTW